MGKLSEKSYVNKTAITGHSIISAVLVAAYLAELLKGTRTIGYLTVFMVLCLGPVAAELLRFLYKGIIIKHNKTEPTYTKTSLFLCEKRRFLWPGLRKEGNLFKLAGPGGLAFFHLTKKEVSKWPMKK